MNNCGGDGGRNRNHFKQGVEWVYMERLKLSWRWVSWGGPPKPRGLGEREGSGRGMRLQSLSDQRACDYSVGRSLRLQGMAGGQTQEQVNYKVLRQTNNRRVFRTQEAGS